MFSSEVIYKYMNLLVTGCFGFIGYNFINFLNNHHKNEFNLIGIDALLSTTSKKNYNEFKSEKGFIFFENDINNIQEIEYLNKNKINFIINFAAESHVDNSITNPESFIHSNVSGTNAILTYAVKNEVENILHISTDEVYGSAKDHFFKEEETLNPSSPYSASKASAEMVCNAFKKTYGLNIKMCRPANNYGFYQQPEKLIPYSIANLINNKNIEVYGDGKNIRHWLHVQDTASAVFEVLINGDDNSIYNLGSNEYFTNIDVTNLILENLNLDSSRLEFVSDRPGHDFKYAVDISKLTSLGWAPKFNFKEVLPEIVEWYVNNKSWWNEEYQNVQKKRKLRKTLI
tara:strand:+ start:1410 stop:2441 length:1032 start_codon:yes stop_codon:yes gene_type:complete